MVKVSDPAGLLWVISAGPVAIYCKKEMDERRQQICNHLLS